MEEKKRPGIPEGQESEYYAGDFSARHPEEKKIRVTVPAKAAVIAGNVWNAARKLILFVLSLGGACALTDPRIRERLLELIRDFITVSGGH